MLLPGLAHFYTLGNQLVGDRDGGVWVLGQAARPSGSPLALAYWKPGTSGPEYWPGPPDAQLCGPQGFAQAIAHFAAGLGADMAAPNWILALTGGPGRLLAQIGSNFGCAGNFLFTQRSGRWLRLTGSLAAARPLGFGPGDTVWGAGPQALLARFADGSVHRFPWPWAKGYEVQGWSFDRNGDLWATAQRVLGTSRPILAELAVRSAAGS